MIDREVLELLSNLEADINEIILNITLNARETDTKEENANKIQQSITRLIKEYSAYLANKQI